MKEKEQSKVTNLVVEKLPHPVELTFVRSKGNKRACELCDPACKAERGGAQRRGEGFTNNGEYEPRPCGCNTRKLVNNRFPARKGWGLRSGNPQSLLKVKNLTTYRLNVLKTSKKIAFTLAEVLITLGVIGIVAAMTIPTLVQSYKEKVTVTKVKQAYSQLANAYGLVTVEHGSPANWDLGTGGMYDEQSHINLANYFKPYMKISEDCVGKSDDYTQKHCVTLLGNYGDNKYKYSQLATGFVLSNGVYVAFRIISNSCTHDFAVEGKNNACGNITIYTEPMSGIQKSGENIFGFSLTRDGIVPEGAPNAVHKFEKACNKLETEPYPQYSPGNMYACTAWIVYNGNMDYLKCPGELSWNGKHRCSD